MKYTFLLLCFIVFEASGQRPLYRDPNAPVNMRVADLLSKMTMEEKAAQLYGWWDGNGSMVEKDSIFNPDKFKEIFKNGVGQIGPINFPILRDIKFKNDVQKYLREKTRLGIPVMFHDEGCHGLMKPQATSFPMTIGLASSWDEDLYEKVYDVTAREMRARGGHQALTPILDIVRDPRWGRIEEMYGEDPFLNSRLGAAQVRGLQGGSTGKIDGDHVLATLKHFTGHGETLGGLNRGSANIAERELREEHMYPFKYVIEKTHPAAVMPSYNEINAVPSHANQWLLQDVLRKEWGYKGVVTSDYEAVAYLETNHAIAANNAEAAALALRAGVSLELPSVYAYITIPELVKQNKISIALIDSMVAQHLRIKFELGLFEKPYVDPIKPRKLVNSPATKALALRAAQESIVLLKNENDLLPLNTDTYKNIAVIGPNADFAYLGGYSGTPLYSVSVLDGIKNKVGKKANVLYAEGCKITTTHKRNSYINWKHVTEVKLATMEENAPLIEAAKKVASQADVVVLVIGDNETTCREAWAPNHLGDRASLDLLGSQMDLVNAVLATGKPVIVYLIGGRPLAIQFIKDHVPAIVEGWYMGQETGNAAADILFGDVAPSGKLTVTFPKSVGHIPSYYNYKPQAKSFNYLFTDNEPLWPFGYGLSYVKFNYTAPQLSKSKIKKNESVTVSVNVTNTGKIKAEEIVQLYVRDEISSVTRPVKELKGFKRVALMPGETKTIELTISPDELAFYDINMNYSVEPGTFNIMVGTSSQQTQSVKLEVTE